MGNKGPLKVQNGTKLILDDHGNNLDSLRISLKSLRSFRGPLLLKPVTGQELFFTVSYNKPALVLRKINSWLPFRLEFLRIRHFLNPLLICHALLKIIEVKNCAIFRALSCMYVFLYKLFRFNKLCNNKLDITN